MATLVLNRRSSGRYHLGISLIEIMIAMAISLILVLVIGSIYLGSSRAWSFQSEFSNIQENARFAVDRMAFDVRMAGFFGCGGAGKRVANRLDVAAGAAQVDFGLGIRGYSPGTGLGNFVVAGDAMVLYRGDDGAGTFRVESQPGIQGGGAAVIRVDRAHGLEAGDIVMMTDCENMVIFQVTPGGGPGQPGQIGINPGGSQTPGNCSTSPQHALGVAPPATVATCATGNFATHNFVGNTVHLLRPWNIAYYIGTGADGRNALFLRNPDGNHLELVPGVENMRILFGVDDNGTRRANLYIPADEVESDADIGWLDVVSVRVSLLIASARDNLLNEPQTYMWDGAPVTANDRRLRQVVTSTIGIRNRLP